LRQFISHTVIH